MTTPATSVVPPSIVMSPIEVQTTQLSSTPSQPLGPPSNPSSASMSPSEVLDKQSKSYWLMTVAYRRMNYFQLLYSLPVCQKMPSMPRAPSLPLAATGQCNIVSSFANLTWQLFFREGARLGLSKMTIL